MNQVVPLAEARPNLVAGARPTAIVPQTMDEAYRLAKAICMAQMAPKGLDTPEKAMVAIMHGLEVGLTPMAALQRIAVVNGRPTIWGDGAVGLVRASGLCEFIRETVAGSGDALTATCEAKRKGEAQTIARSFSVADAKKAGLWGKAGPWQQYPTRMLAMRARAFALRDGFADVLGGLYLREELEEQPSPSRPSRDAAPPPPPAVEPAKPAQAAIDPPPPPPPPPASPTSLLDGEVVGQAPQEVAQDILGEIGEAGNEEWLDHVLDAREEEIGALPKAQRMAIENAADERRKALRTSSPLASG